MWNGIEPLAADDDDEMNSDGFFSYCSVIRLLVSVHSVSVSNTPSQSVLSDARCSLFLTPFACGDAVAQSVEALPYKPEGLRFDSRCHWNFSLT